MTQDKRSIPFSPPDITEREIEAVTSVLRSGWITTGARTKQLESSIAEWVGTRKCVCLSSQTACAEMALRLLRVGEGDEVITTAYTYTASAAVIAHVGARIVLVDTCADSLEMDGDALARAITENTKAVIPVDLAGIPCDYERIFAIAEAKKHLFRPKNELQRAIGRVAVLADCAHALGASRHGQMVGGIADLSAFSFHAVKNLTTAEGGALTWRSIDGVDDEEIYTRLQLLSLHGQSKDAYAKAALGAWEYDVLGTYYKCNMTDMAAALGLAQLARYPALLARRKEIVQHYDAALRPLGVQTLSHYTEEWLSSGHLYLTRLCGITPAQRNEIIAEMARRGVACNVHYKPLPMLSAYRALGFDIKDYPHAYAQFANEITLPLHTRLDDGDVAYVCKQYAAVIKEYLP